MNKLLSAILGYVLISVFLLSSCSKSSTRNPVAEAAAEAGLSPHTATTEKLGDGNRVEINSSNPITLRKENLTGYFMHSDVPPIGDINSSSTTINKIFTATNNSYLSNLFGYPTDCPQREKNGWTGDAQIAIETGLYSFDGITVYEKWLADHRDEQQPNGVLPSIIPTGGWGYEWGNGPDWTSTIAIIPWNIYLFYGDDKLLKDCYENIKRYVDHIDENYPGLQTELSVPLYWGLVPEEFKSTIAKSLAKKIEADSFKLDVGLLGTKAILNALSENGYPGLAYRLASSETQPSWGWWIVNGATTLYENWPINAASDISMNHIMFGEIGAWLYKGLGGIKPDASKPGFKNVLLQPNFVQGLSHFNATHKGPYGTILSSWKRTVTGINYKVIVPANSTATVTLKLETGQQLFKEGKQQMFTKGLYTVQLPAGEAHFEIR